VFSGVRARLCVGVITALGFLFVLTSAASAAPAWLGALDLSSVTAFSQQPAVAVDSSGEAVALWTDNTGALLASVHPPDGGWQAPKTIATGASFGDQAAFDAQGDATALWVNTSGVVQSAMLPSDAAAWSAPAPISPSDAGSPQLAIDAQGDALAVWTLTESASRSIVEAAFRPAGTGTWQNPIPLSTLDFSASSDEVASPQVALDAQGDATAVWSQTTGSNKSIVWAASRLAANGIWQTPVPLSSSTVGSGSPRLVIDAAGRSTAIWTDATGIHSSDQQPGGAWSSPVAVSSVAGSADPDLAVDSQGDEALVWDQPAGSSQEVAEAAARAPTGAWQTPVTLSGLQPNTSTRLPEPQVRLDARGDAVAIWNAFDGTNNSLQAMNRTVSGSWPAPGNATTLSGDSTEDLQAALAVDPQGNAAVIWAIFTGSTSLVQAAGYDAAGPLLNELSIPSAGTVRVPVTFSVSPLDAWSAVASTSWSFGDGQQGSDQTLTHTYATPGTYTVTVTSADALGNTTSESKTITVAAAPKPPPASKAPVLSRVSEKHKKWRETAKSGTDFSFSVDQAATVALAFGKTSSGREVNGKCRAATRRSRKHPACRRVQAEGTLTDAVAAGRHAIAFRGRVGRDKLPLGAYTVALTATNSSKQRSRPVTLEFTVVK
jgi:PKD repeat protein